MPLSLITTCEAEEERSSGSSSARVKPRIEIVVRNRGTETGDQQFGCRMEEVHDGKGAASGASGEIDGEEGAGAAVSR